MPRFMVLHLAVDLPMNGSTHLWSRIMDSTGESFSIAAAIPYVAVGRISLPVHDARAVGTRSCCVPGMVESEGTGIMQSDFRKNTEAQTPLGRIGQPEDIAPAVVFFASPESAWITGET